MTRVLLCDADDCLFPTEEPAFAASTAVTNRLLEELGVDRRWEPGELRAFAAGRNFRATTAALLADHGIAVDADQLERWVEEERRAVIAHLERVLEPDPRVSEPLARLAHDFELAVVSSSALARLAACFTATGLDDLFPAARRFSAQDSLPVPTSKPDPAVYRLAGERLGVAGDETLAIEDSVSGARSAVAAGFPTVGLLRFVPEDEREARAAALREEGVQAVAASWEEIEELSRRSRSSSAPAARSQAR